MDSVQMKTEKEMSSSSNQASLNQPSSSFPNRHVNIRFNGSNNVAAGRDIIQNNNYCVQSSSESVTVTAFRLIDKPTPYFAGRQELITKIHYLLKECAEKTDYEERIVVLRGFGGMGKSELARKYVATHIYDPIIKNVAWIDSETKDSVNFSFKSLAKYLNIAHGEEDSKLLSQEFYRHFSTHVKTGLIVFDNVEQLRDQSPYHGIFDYLPTQHLDHLPLILITSRINDWQIPLERKYILEISGLSEEAAVKLLCRSLKLDERMQQDCSVCDAVHRLANAVEGYPLGLTLAGSTITSFGSENIKAKIDKYIIRLDASKQDWIKDEHSVGAATKYKLIMSTVWDATLQKIIKVEKDSAYALELLCIMAYFPVDFIFSNDIRRLYKQVFEQTDSDFDKGMHILRNYSLVSLVSKYSDKQIRIHRLIQRCAQNMLELKNDYSYLGVVAKYKSYYFVERTKNIRKSFKEWPWSSKIVHEFIFLLADVLNQDIALEMTQCLDKICASQAKDDYQLVYDFCLFYLHNKQINNLNSISGTCGSVTKENNAFILAAGTLFNTKKTPSYLFKDSNIKICIFEVFQNDLYIADFYNGLKDNVKEQFGKILLDFASSSLTNHINCEDALVPLYKYLSLYYQDANCADARKYLDAAIRNYKKLNSGKKSLAGFPFESLRKFFEGSKTKQEYQDTFLEAGGLIVVATEIKRCHKLKYGPNDSLLRLLVQITRWQGCSQKLVNIMGFMNDIKERTTAYFNCEGYYFQTRHLDILLPWFGLFSVKRRMKDPNGKEWSITSVAEEIKQFLSLCKNYPPKIREIAHYTKKFKIWTLESMLKPYVTAPSGVYDVATIEFANLLRNAYVV